MRTYGVRVYVGPCYVSQFAELFRSVKLTVVSEGTEHVTVLVNAVDYLDAKIKIQDRYNSKYTPTFKIGDLSILSEASG